MKGKQKGEKYCYSKNNKDHNCSMNLSKVNKYAAEDKENKLNDLNSNKIEEYTELSKYGKEITISHDRDELQEC